MAPWQVERRRRWRRQGKERKEAMMSIHDLSDDVLRCILLHLDSPLYVIRAACVCKRWRGVVTDGGADEGRAFLRLASSLHPPTVVGRYHNLFTRGNHLIGHLFVPSSSSLPNIDGRRFSVDDFHRNYSSVVADCRGGLVLFNMRYGPCARSVPDFVVYDPLTRERRRIPRPLPPSKQDYRYCIGHVLLHDGDDDGHISISNFRLLYRLDAADDEPQACVFSTANGGEWDWCVSVDQVYAMDLQVYRRSRDIFNYTLPWPQFLRACP